jgi:hypothetical protein
MEAFNIVITDVNLRKKLPILPQIFTDLSKLKIAIMIIER